MSAQPLYFESDSHTLFGWLHSPGRHRGVGLVICNPFGYEAVCAHRSLRCFAEGAAAIDVPALRFDYAGTGDSADIDPLCDQMERWTADALNAVHALRRLTGVQKVVVLGVRLGALIAALAAARDPSAVDELIMVAPTLSGRRYVRELRTTRLAALMGVDHTQAPSASLSEEVEAAGFTLSAASCARLSAIDLHKSEAVAVNSLLVIDGDILPQSKRWAEAQAASGGQVEYQALPGLVPMIMTPPQFAQTPTQMIHAVCSWLGALAAPDAVAFDVPAAAALNLTEPTAAWSETPSFFDAEGILFGILTRPPPALRNGRGLLLINAGADHHIGANGMYVALARRWAAQGFNVLRMDLSGLGDSATRPGAKNDEVFPKSAVDDVRTAVDYLRQSGAAVDVTLAGLCSGAYHALRAAVAGVPTVRILMINPQNYFWEEGMTIHDMQDAELVRLPSLYRDRALSRRTWKRLLLGEVNVRYVARIFWSRLALTLSSRARALARALHIHLPRDLARELQELAAKGVDVVLVFARGEPGIALLDIETGNSASVLNRRCRLRILDSGDHVFSRRQSRLRLEQALDEELATAAGSLALSARPEAMQGR